MSVMMSQILNFADSWKTPKSKYLENTIFSFSKKTLIAPKSLCPLFFIKF